MLPKTPKLLNDILDSAGFIIEITKDRTADEYAHNRLVHDAVERNFAIIGEAINRLVRYDPDTAS